MLDANSIKELTIEEIKEQRRIIGEELKRRNDIRKSTKKKHNYNVKHYYVYALLLENNKYYVGITTSINLRFNKHISGRGSKWTAIYKPIRVIYLTSLGYTTEKNALLEENFHTHRLMNDYGYQNVRGGSLCSVVLNEHQVKKAFNKMKRDYTK